MTFTLHHGDCLEVMAGMEAGSVDAVVTDPPYSSGGAMRGDRMGTTTDTYLRSDSQQAKYLPNFSGDNRDQRGYGYWCALWMGKCLDLLVGGGIIAVFTDWRQLPVATDAVQAGGFIWRGIVPWSKPNSRPQKGRFSAQCEYVVWGSKGPMKHEGECLPGWYEALAPSAREHVTQKPVAVMASIVRICKKGGTVLDPFMGSGTTGVACAMEGREFIGIERESEYVEIARRRIEAASAQERLPV